MTEEEEMREKLIELSERLQRTQTYLDEADARLSAPAQATPSR